MLVQPHSVFAVLSCLFSRVLMGGIFDTHAHMSRYLHAPATIMPVTIWYMAVNFYRPLRCYGCKLELPGQPPGSALPPEGSNCSGLTVRLVRKRVGVLLAGGCALLVFLSVCTAGDKLTCATRGKRAAYPCCKSLLPPSAPPSAPATPRPSLLPPSALASAPATPRA